MILEDLTKESDKLQLKYVDKNLNSIYNGGMNISPNICLVFMNPTARNMASSKE